MNRESKRLPRLVNIPENKIPGNEKIIQNKFFSLNVILLIIFLGFLIFFLLNCRSGVFKNIDLGPIPYSLK